MGIASAKSLIDLAIKNPKSLLIVANFFFIDPATYKNGVLIEKYLGAPTAFARTITTNEIAFQNVITSTYRLASKPVITGATKLGEEVFDNVLVKGANTLDDIENGVNWQSISQSTAMFQIWG